MAPKKNTIDYIEFPLIKNAETKKFYTDVFGWQFTDYGPDYIGFSGAGINGGFNGTENTPANAPGTLAVLYAENLEGTEEKVRKASGKIVKPVFSFPGGRRFHFQDPNGNELAVWSDK